MKYRAGKYIKQPLGYKAFIPETLPPKPAVELDEKIYALLSESDRAIAKLDGITTVLPNPDIFIAMYVKKEALLSSQIEGTQASLEGILEFDANLKPKEDIREIKEVINYINALDYGKKRLEKLPMSLRLIKEIHKILIKGTRGEHKKPGEFRTSQNWVGPPGASINEADYIPPPPNMVISAMGELEKFLHSKDIIPPLVKIALIHAQFETIHPFLDGNGRIGRLLITFYLMWKGILSKPLLYLSYYFKKNKALYYDMLMKVRNDGAWEKWITFFLQGICETSKEAVVTARDIIVLREEYKEKIFKHSISSIYAIRLLDLVFDMPLVNIKIVAQRLSVSNVTAIKLVNKFETLGILQETTGGKWNKEYINKEYLEIIARGTRE
ncbi:cell filamentation protein Fic [bacterium SM23_31]|nr:MAG: cell filamentation protein Fic [bacterium SM23_31]